MKNSIPELQSERLVLRCLNDGDTDFVVKLLNSPGWIEFIGNRNVNTREDAIRYLHEKVLPLYDIHKFGPYAVCLKDEDEALGFCGLFKKDFLDYPDIGFAFLPEQQGKGFAYESSMTVLEHERKIMRNENILAITLEKNVRSVSLLERLGFSYDKQVKYPESGEELMLYVLRLMESTQKK